MMSHYFGVSIVDVTLFWHVTETFLYKNLPKSEPYNSTSVAILKRLLRKRIVLKIELDVFRIAIIFPDGVGVNRIWGGKWIGVKKKSGGGAQ
jgi:hypothetical protein